MINVPKDHLHTVKQILAGHVPHCKVVVYGSRASGSSKQYSDLDLAVIGESPMPVITIAKLKTAFSESQLPFKVDVLDWNGISPSFRKVIEEKNETIQESGNAQ